MSTAADSAYFPPLDQCLAGNTRLISWRTAYRALCDEQLAVETTHLQAFFSDDEAITLLSTALDPFSAPNARTGAAFDTKTAPINVAQSNNADYDLDEIKNDAKWLSTELQIEELAALRVAIVEWQERPTDQLLNTAYNGSSGLSGSASTALTRSTMDLSASTSGPARPPLAYADQEVRRQRLLSVHLSEKNHILRLGADLLSRCAVSKTTVLGEHTGAFRTGPTGSWIDEVAARVTDIMCPSTGRAESEAFITKCIAKVKAVLECGEASTAWPASFASESRAGVYVDALGFELIYTLRLLLAALYQFDGITGGQLVLSWFTLMEQHQFLQEGKKLLPSNLDLPQLLISIVSVEIMKLQLAVGEILQAAGVDLPVLAGSHYVNDEACLSNLNLVFYRTSLRGISIAAPAILAWSIISSVIRDMALLHRDVRESHAEFGSDDNTSGHGRRTSLRRGSRHDNASVFEQLYIRLQSPELEGDHRDDLPRHFLLTTVDRMRVFALITMLSSAVSASYSSHAESGTAFICKDALFDLTREALPLVQYDTEVLDAVLSILTPVEHSRSSKWQAGVLADKFLNDSESLRPAVLGEALARFPYELSPLLSLSTVLARAETRYRREQSLPEIADVLLDMQTFTQEVPAHFRSYELTDEINDSNTMKLTEPLPIIVRHSSTSFSNGQHLLTTGDGVDSDIGEHFIPAETSGTIIKEQKPMVLMLNHPHSALGYLTTLLYTFVKGSELSPAASQANLDRFSAAEIIVLFTALLSACLDHDGGAAAAQDLLTKFGEPLGANHDVISIIADIFEAELLAHLEQAAQDGSLEIVAAGAEFLNTIIKISPERVWSILAKSSLLGLASGAMSLIAVVNGTEVQLGEYRFLQACVEMQSLLIQDAIAGLAKRTTQPTDVVKATRFSLAITQDSPDTTPARTMSVVLSAYQKILLDALQSFPDWKWSNSEQRCCLILSLLKSFSKLLQSTYGIDVAKGPSQRLTSVLAPAAESLIKVCAPDEGSNTLAATISRMLQEGPLVVNDQILTHTRQLLIKQIQATLDFLVSVLRIARESNNILANGVPSPEWRTLSQKRSHNLAATLLQNMPTFASLLASDHAFKAEVYTLLGELVKSVGMSDQDPPSILAHFDVEGAHAFLQMVTQLDRPLCDVQVERQIWDFLATIMDSKQQWFAIYLLTGKLPKSRAHRRHDDETKARPLLAYVLTELASIADLPPQRAVGMLKFIAIAQQTWVWATNEVRSHADFLTNTLAWLGALQSPPRNPTPDAAITSAREHEMAAYLCDILAINVHASLEIGDKTVLRALVSKLEFLRDHGARVNAWNRSLHKSLESNLKRAFPQSDLSDFKRTSVHPAPYGRAYVYDSDIAATIFRHNRSWAGATADQGFADEFGRANANLSLLHAQSRLLKSWKTLAATLCDCADQEAALQVELARVATQCLIANSDPQLDQPGVADAMQIRTELSFVVMSKLVGLQNMDTAMKDFLPAAWNLVGTSQVDYDVATTVEDARYYRQLLQVLYLAIQPHAYIGKTNNGTEMQFLPPQTASILVNVLGRVIAPGFRALCGNLHSDIELALPADFALLTALLQGVLAVPGINSVQTLLSDIVAGSTIIRGALSLFSWADQLVDEETQDPVYGEIAIMFLLALSTVRPIAEQMALEGVLAQLASANLSNYLRKQQGKGPFDEPQRMFVIWSEGFLPLCLNLLDAVGPAIAGEISAFLNSFPEQLDRAAKSLVNETPTPNNPRAGAVTLGLVAEAHSLSMISLILSSDMARGAADGINAADIPELDFDATGTKALVEALTRSKRSLADRIRPGTPLEERWANTPVTGSSSNMLVQKVEREMHAMLACFESADQTSP
ncbi:hypothetical protein Slin15195_G011380 [Septoria linicola]|uniref:Nucleoporin NUP188 n=1 Tax=Septoria linicola TaxID=215465 RepID=A0A9Q9EFD3_9PEZI|nr:hypothetical protein Slin14017_G011390 [Septoria linicola]USW47819.1 hypothetical protein Slin15195_G011380 [Septoria linicola]